MILLADSAAQATTRFVKTTCTNGITTYNPAADSCTGGLSPVYNSIANGLAALAGGDILYIRAGTYHERILYTQSLPSGTAGSPTTIAAYPGDTVWLDGSNASNVHIINIANVTGANTDTRYITFDGINIDCVNVSGGDACVGNGSTDGLPYPSHLVFRNYEIKNTNSTNNQPGGFAPAHLIGGSFNEFRNCYVHDNGLMPKPVDNFGGYAFYINGDDHVIDNCRLNNHGGYAIQAYKYGTTDGANRITISNNKIQDTGVNSIGTTTGGVVIGSGSGHKVFNNTISTGYDGIEVNYSCTDCVIANNTIYNSQSVGITLAATVVRPIVTNNIIMNSNGANISNEGATSPTINTNLCYGSGGSANCGLTGDPLFVNAAARDFRLQAGSPAINAGTTLNAPYNVDINGATRLSGAYDIGAYEYGIVTPPVSQLVVALPLDEGTGTIAVDVSGLKNNATLFGGATWDNDGKYGKAIVFDGTGYLNVPASASLALAPAMTLEAWVYPTVTFSGFATVIRQDRYYLYAASEPGYCNAPALAPLGGYATTENIWICATSAPPTNQWSHLAVTHDGVTMIFYLNGNIIATKSSTDPMVQTANNLTIGASVFGEYFIGKIDEPRVYTYARTLPQIQGDMNTPLIGPPGKYVEIAAPASVEISSAASIEIAAD